MTRIFELFRGVIRRCTIAGMGLNVKRPRDEGPEGGGVSLGVRRPAGIGEKTSDSSMPAAVLRNKEKSCMCANSGVRGLFREPFSAGGDAGPVSRALWTPGLTLTEGHIYALLVLDAGDRRMCRLNVQDMVDQFSESPEVVRLATLRLSVLGLIALEFWEGSDLRCFILDLDGRLYGGEARS